MPTHTGALPAVGRPDESDQTDDTDETDVTDEKAGR